MSTTENKYPFVKVSKQASIKSEKIGVEWDQHRARSDAALGSTMNAALVVESFAKAPFGGIDCAAIVESLNSQVREINRGDMSGPEAMLYSQATALQSIFVSLARRANGQEYLRSFEA